MASASSVSQAVAGTAANGHSKDLGLRVGSCRTRIDEERSHVPGDIGSLREHGTRALTTHAPG